MVIVKITAEDIRYGKCGMSSECPGALAINRLLKEPFRGTVSGSVIRLFDPARIGWKFADHVVQLKTPLKLRSFIIAFDMQRNPAPTEFELPIPQEMLKEQQ